MATKIADLEKLSPRVIKDIVDYLVENNHAKDETEARTRMRTMNVADLFDAWLCWNGIVGYTSTIMGTLWQIQDAHGEHEPKEV